MLPKYISVLSDLLYHLQIGVANNVADNPSFSWVADPRWATHCDERLLQILMPIVKAKYPTAEISTEYRKSFLENGIVIKVVQNA